MVAKPMESTIFVPLPLLRALLTNLFRIDVAPLSQLIPEDELGVANAIIFGENTLKTSVGD